MMKVWKILSVGLVSLACCTVALSDVAVAEDTSAAEHADGEHGDSHEDAHGDDHAAGHGGDTNPMSFKTDLAIWTAVVFFVLLIVLTKFAWKPIVEALEGREQKIADDLAAAESQNAEARRLLEEYDKKLASAADEVRELLEEARRDAEHTKGEILAEAKAAAASEHERALRDVRNATDAALKELAESSANLAVDLAGKIVKQQLDPSQHEALIREGVSNFPKPSNN